MPAHPAHTHTAPMLAQIDYPGPEGFLGTRGSLMLDVVVVAMVVVLLVLAWSITQVRCGRYTLHKWTQVVLTTVLMLTVVAFEVEMRLFGWEDRAAGEIGGHAAPIVWKILYVHLVFAISTFFLWPIVVGRALRKYPRPPAPGAHSSSHVFWAWVASVCMTVTAVTGWLFYYFGFVRNP